MHDMKQEIVCGTLFECVPSSVDLIYIDPPFMTQRDFGEFNDKWNNLQEYINEITKYCKLAWDNWLKSGGVFIIHIDPRTSHYYKVELDKLFGYKYFNNEIIWNYSSGGASKNKLSSKHDVLLVYRKGESGTFNIIREPYATPNVVGRIGFHPDGRMLTDVWNVSIISTTGKERVGYPTQKPLQLLERIIKIYTNEGDTVLDFFAGSGTTGVAAKHLNRGYILIDKNKNAIDIINERINLNA